MNNKRILSGYDIVAKGATKIEVSLPELGIKEVFPNKSWLENKQIQAAIEARKQLIEVERIDKSGALSHAVWREELMLAEVTQNVGSCWQYLGHNAGKKLYLKPEEALFMLEINSLCLKHNNVKVSLQQAYTLLLRDKITLLQYKVYASLSRIGFRVYRHSTPETNSEQIIIDTMNVENEEKISNKAEVSDKPSENKSNDVHHKLSTDFSNLNPTEDLQKELKQGIANEDSTNNIELMQEMFTNKIKHKKVCLKKLQALKKRQLKPCNIHIMHKFFDGVPDLLDKNIVNVKAPDKHLLPSTINLTKAVYKVNLLNIQKKEKNIRPSSNESNIYSVNDEVNGSHIRRLRNTSNRTGSHGVNTAFASNGWTHSTNTGYATQTPQYRPFVYWRSRQPFNYYNFNTLFQRPFLPSWYFAPNFYFYPRAQPNLWRPNFHNTNRNINRKRSRKNAKKQHLDGILKLAARLKQLIISGNTQEENIQSLQRLIQTYNTRYKTKVRLNGTFDIVVDETIVDTITLDDDDDEGPSSKRRKADPLFEENLNNLKMFGLRLKDLEYNDKSSGKHRRAFSKLLKTFNESYNNDYYLNEDYVLVCRNQIDLDTSNSDLDCIIEETPAVSGKKLKNPFNILKRLSEMQKPPQNEVTPNSIENTGTTNKKYSEVILNTFTKGWLPGEDDFGRAEIISKNIYTNNIIDIRREDFLYDFIKIQTCKYDNWLDLKKSFFNSIQAAIVEFQGNMPNINKMEIDSIVKPGDCADMESVLKKLSIIKTDKEITDVCNLAIDFDVYNRDVKNFRKSNRPAPHFRIICINESTNLPPGDEIAAVHSKYDDQVAIVFAIVGIDSISYVQINPTDLPVFISNNT